MLILCDSSFYLYMMWKKLNEKSLGTCFSNFEDDFFLIFHLLFGFSRLKRSYLSKFHCQKAGFGLTLSQILCIMSYGYRHNHNSTTMILSMLTYTYLSITSCIARCIYINAFDSMFRWVIFSRRKISSLFCE